MYSSYPLKEKNIFKKISDIKEFLDDLKFLLNINFDKIELPKTDVFSNAALLYCEDSLFPYKLLHPKYPYIFYHRNLLVRISIIKIQEYYA